MLYTLHWVQSMYVYRSRRDRGMPGAVATGLDAGQTHGPRDTSHTARQNYVNRTVCLHILVPGNGFVFFIYFKAM